MRVFPSLRRLTAAFAVALLPFGLAQGGVHAQSTGDATARSVTNVAEASWDEGGARQRISSNIVRFEVSAQPAVPPSIRVYRRAPGTGAGSELVYRTPRCTASAAPAQRLSALNTGDLAGGAPAISSTSTATVQQTDRLRGGPLFFEINAAAANRDPAAIDSLTVVLTTIEGDRETMTVFETEANSGIFAGVIDTLRIPPALVQEDCRLSVGADSRITVAAVRPGSDATLVSADVTVLVLADRFLKVDFVAMLRAIDTASVSARMVIASAIAPVSRIAESERSGIDSGGRDADSAPMVGMPEVPPLAASMASAASAPATIAMIM